jgi:DNA repair exonuclease SbcCD nuclease subunit/predicted  nucleic acid-binding Zn-ribbon protein
MSLLVTADWQTEWSNLDVCSEALKQVKHIVKDYGITTIAFCGDLKQSYNPVDIRIVKWWQKAIHDLVKMNVVVIVLLGNHDRVGQYSDADNWLPILKRAGAQCYDTAGVSGYGEGRLFILPFSNNKELKRRANDLVNKFNPDKEKDILLFHANLIGARYNRFEGSESSATLSASDLRTSHYRYCIGGDIHFPQKFGEKKNIYYVGSPFCTSWGETNQRKRYLVARKDSIRSVHSSIPGWFDRSVSGFDRAKPKTWRGARIRLLVSCDAGEDYGKRLERARKEAEGKYKGAIIYVVPKFKDKEQVNAIITTNDSDEKKLKEYVRASGQTQFRGREIEKLISYMCTRVGRFGNGLRGSAPSFAFKKAIGRNFLSFKDVEIDFTQKGIIVVQGINHDRGIKCSNGSGKTSLFQLLPVALFGGTFKTDEVDKKGQTADKWANRWRTGEPAFSEVSGRVQSKKVRIIRGRRPTLLKIRVNGKDQSSGMKSNEKTGTQSLIEQVTGYTWQTLANSVYIDRSVSQAFLSGTKKQRTEVLSRFQNLERFEKALALVKQDVKSNQEETTTVRERMERICGSIEESRDALHEMRKMRDGQIEGAYQEYRKSKKRRKEWDKKNGKLLKGFNTEAKYVATKYEKATQALTKVEQEYTVMASDIDYIRNKIAKWNKWKHTKQCPTCFQKVPNKWIGSKLKVLEKKLNFLKGRIKQVETARTGCRLSVQRLDGKHGEINSQITKLEKERSILTAFVRTTDEQYRDLYSQKHSASSSVETMKRKLKRYKGKYESLRKRKRKLRDRAKLYLFASEAFSRDGIPAFLNRQLCPVLNRAADYYSELFCDRDIQLKFSVDEGEFVPTVINARGGERIGDQSTGEKALAGLIASFALREVAPKSNILILDEPAEGVDEPVARQFARALKKLSKRFGLIFIATHNTHILSELSGEGSLIVEKRNKISRIVHSVQ